MTDTVRHIQAKCHCTNITLELELPVARGKLIPVRACGCSFCQKHGGVYTSHPHASVTVRIKRSADVTRYRFGTKTADFFVCKSCGVVPLVVSRISGRDYAVVNINSFEDVAASAFDSAPSDFDGEGTQSRLERRAKTWIPNVQVHTSS